MYLVPSKTVREEMESLIRYLRAIGAMETAAIAERTRARILRDEIYKEIYEERPNREMAIRHGLEPR